MTVEQLIIELKKVSDKKREIVANDWQPDGAGDQRIYGVLDNEKIEEPVYLSL